MPALGQLRLFDKTVEVPDERFTEVDELQRVIEDVGPLLSQAQAAAVLGVSRSCVDLWVERGVLRSRKLLGTHYVSARDVRIKASAPKNRGGRGHKTKVVALNVAFVLCSLGWLVGTVEVMKWGLDSALKSPVYHVAGR